MNDNWIDKYTHTIINGELPTIDENTGEIVMQTKIDGVWQNTTDELDDNSTIDN